MSIQKFTKYEIPINLCFSRDVTKYILTVIEFTYDEYDHLLFFEPPHDKINKIICAHSEDSDQPGRIRVSAVRSMGS